VKVRYYSVTSTSSKIAFTFSSSTTEFRKAEIAEPDVPVTSGPKSLSVYSKEVRNQAIRERFANGETLKVISKDYGLDCSRVSRICKGVERKVKPKSKNEGRDQTIRERFANGEMLKVISKDYGLDCSRVSRICKGVERKEKTKRGRKPINE